MDEIDEIIQTYQKKHLEYEIFLAGVRTFFEKHPLLNNGKLPIVHSIKYRLKDPEHLRDKLYRKREEGKNINQK